MSTVVKDLGAVSAYAYAVEKGYTGTEAEFAELMADYAEVGQRAEDAADSALESKTAAQTAATTATNKASEATTAATTATNKAAEAQADADAAALDASQALSAASKATTKATEATTAAATATSAKTDAVAANTAAQSAKTAAQTAQTGAETAAASVQSSAEQIAQNATDIEDLKSDLTTKADATDLLKAFPTDTASGAVASFADGANVPVKSLIVNIDPVQEGSGDPSPDNVRPISGWDTVNVRRTGKNLLDNVDPDVVDAYIGTKNNAVRLIYTKSNRTVIIPVKPKTTYTYSFNRIVLTTSIDDSNVILFDEYPQLDITIGTLTGVNMYSGDKRTFTTGETTKYIAIKIANINNTDFSGTLSASQLELGSTATAYEPYSGQSINIQLGQTVYGGTLDVTKGELVIDMAMADLGTLNWTYMSAAAVFKCVSYPAQKPNIICSQYATNNPYKTCEQMGDGTIQAGTTDTIVKDSRYTDATEFKTAMNGVQLCYELSAPITVSLTPHEVRSLLGDNNVWADSGDSEVTYRADPTLYVQRKIAEAISALS